MSAELTVPSQINDTKLLNKIIEGQSRPWLSSHGKLRFIQSSFHDGGSSNLKLGGIPLNGGNTNEPLWAMISFVGQYVFRGLQFRCQKGKVPDKL